MKFWLERDPQVNCPSHVISHGGKYIWPPLKWQFVFAAVLRTEFFQARFISRAGFQFQLRLSFNIWRFYWYMLQRVHVLRLCIVPAIDFERLC
jgi:hypothetical protein